MATAALTNFDVEVLPLYRADLKSLDALFDEQCKEWLSLLGWDYTGPSRIIRDVARRRELSGFVVRIGGQLAGFAFYVIEADRCSIGDIYVSKAWRDELVDRHLVNSILAELDRIPGVNRIESQCVVVNSCGADDVFRAHGFNRFLRQYMMVDLSRLENGLSKSAGSRQRTCEYSFRGWTEEDFTNAGRVIQASYQGRQDSLINSQYQTRQGCLELLSILTDDIWCGEFLPKASRVAVLKESKEIVGVLLASRISPATGHISQISVLPQHQGRGLGRKMIEGALREFRLQGCATASLAVTETNTQAVGLYESCGFRVMHSFPVFYWEKKR